MGEPWSSGSGEGRDGVSVHGRKGRDELFDLVAHFVIRGSDDCDVAHLASLAAAFLAVQVHARSETDGLPGDSVCAQEVVLDRGRGAKEVEHGAGGDEDGNRRKREGEDGVEVGGVLRRGARFDRVVTRVVWSRGDLVQQQCAYQSVQSAARISTLEEEWRTILHQEHLDSKDTDCSITES